MPRYIGQFLAIFAALASSVNAQCLLACSLQSIPRPISIQAQHAGHACCPERKPSLPGDQNKHQQRCSDPLLTAGDVAVANTMSQDPDAAQCFAVVSGYSFHPLVPIQRSALLRIVDSSGLHYLPHFSVLRV